MDWNKSEYKNAKTSQWRDEATKCNENGENQVYCTLHRTTSVTKDKAINKEGINFCTISTRGRNMTKMCKKWRQWQNTEENDFYRGIAFRTWMNECEMIYIYMSPEYNPRDLDCGRVKIYDAKPGAAGCQHGCKRCNLFRKKHCRNTYEILLCWWKFLFIEINNIDYIISYI